MASWNIDSAPFISWVALFKLINFSESQFFYCEMETRLPRVILRNKCESHRGKTKLLSMVPTQGTQDHRIVPMCWEPGGHSHVFKVVKGTCPVISLLWGWRPQFSRMIFRENNKAGFYLFLQPLAPREAGRGIETSGTLTPWGPEGGTDSGI